MKLYIISGEPSGDLQASKLMYEMNKIRSISWRGIGGDRMLSENLSLLYHMRDMAYFGFFEVLKHLRVILKKMKNTKQDILEFKPDAIIFIDYPGFNLKIAKFAKANNIPTIYYITPQLWAWHKDRVKLMKKYIDNIVNIFPFEVDFYNSYNIKSYYFGHPITEGLDVQSLNKYEYLKDYDDYQHIGVLPGSRLNEVKSLLPEMLEALLEYSKERNLFISLAKVNHIDLSIYEEIVDASGIDRSLIRIVDDFAYDIMNYSDFLIMSSGTATLEAACFKTPMIVCYKLSFFTSLIVKYVVKIKNICLVNIVAGKKIVPELIHQNFTKSNILKEIHIINNNNKQMLEELEKVQKALMFKNVSKNVALHIDHFLSN